jgi:AdoMet-dependent heme synthase
MPYVFDDAPHRIYWELTRACDLACSHCRASANPCADPRELNTRDIFRILEELASESKPHVVLTGGDPLKRRDFFDIVERTVALGLSCSVSPSATPLLTREAIATLAALRVAAMSLSLDGSTPARHDTLRGVVGTFGRTMQLAGEIVGARIQLQINTLVTSETVDDLPQIHDLVRSIGADRWSLFFLITTGRGRSLGQITPSRAERVLNWAADRAAAQKPNVTTTEAPHYRRIALERSRGDTQAARGPLMRGFGVRDGNGVMFISHTGDVQPSGFLPITAGYARTESPLHVYRHSPLFRDLRRPDRFTGRCGCCEFRSICGGSRARAYAATGDPLGSDPLCAYIPPAVADRQAMLRD